MTVHEPARHPSDLAKFVVSRITAGDIDGIVALYDPDAILVADDGKVLVGQAAIRAFYCSLLKSNAQFAPGREAPPLFNDAIALTSSTLADGTTIAEIARLQTDGSWLWIIDQPAIARLHTTGTPQVRATTPIGPEAHIANPLLLPLAFLIGEWNTEGRHPMVPGKRLIGRTSFAWDQGGAFLLMHSEIDAPDFPSGVALIGSDDVGTLTMIYFDERRVSRVYEAMLGDQSLTLRRDAPDMSQTIVFTPGENGSLNSVGRLSENGGAWGDDLSQVFTRA
ncbi:hypothetical protein [Phenylobacterium sp.]|uniref:YybH family protein n=1 Tax=Phenylobacterium sp. TaxID=1871053 RepID=UPI00286AD7E7|nr:hypothetical protein [Phenylobacterium sp.]